MFEETNIIAGLEIGTSKICIVIGEQKADGSLNIIGVGQALTKGVRKGEIIDPKTVEEDVRTAVAEAEQMANVEIRSVFVAVTGSHIKGFNHRGFHRVLSADYEITQEDVEDVINNAKAINLPMDHTLILDVRQHFMVDGEGGIADPVGMHGARLEVDLHVIHGKTNRLQNVTRIVRGISLQVNDVVFSGLASSLALLTPEQKDLGVLVIDLGAGTTEYAVFSEGILRHSGVLTVGGDHATNDLAYGLKISLHRAEKLKLQHGSALIDETAGEQLVGVTDERGMEIKQVKAVQVQTIVSLRVEEILKIVAEELAQSGLTHLLRAGVLLCGGGARMANITTLAEKVFQMKCEVGHANGVSGLSQTLDEPEFATAIGLVKYGAIQQRQSTANLPWWLRLWDWLKNLLGLGG